MVNDEGNIASAVLPLPLRQCWPYFREPELIREWHGWEYDDLDAEITEIYEKNARPAEDHRSIALGTHLFTFTEEDGRTRADLTRGPLEDDSPWREYLPDLDEGWTSFLQQLRFKLERHPDESRRTIFYAGTPKEQTISPIQWIGLGQVGLQQIGAKYGATVGPGDALTGEVWFVSGKQIGVTVDAWGDGLLIVSDGARGGPPYTSGQAILTTYGLEDDERTDLTHRWNEWWARHY